MNTTKLNTRIKKRLSDTFTPVGMYLKIRDKFPNSILMESSDYHGDEHSFSYICCDPVSRFELSNDHITIDYPDGERTHSKVGEKEEVIEALDNYRKSFDFDYADLPFIKGGLFGYTSYNAVQYFEDVEIQDFKGDERRVPEMIYHVYRYIIVHNHFNNELHIIDNFSDGTDSGVDEIEAYLEKRDFATFKFNTKGEETSNYNDDQYREMVQKGIDHCHRGDVFQIVVSRRFEQEFEGDDFNAYRMLRSVNPSPHLFYFDFGSFKIFGSSPEAQIVVKEGKATIYPIAGTFRRTGNDTQDAELATKLFDDPKENSEHIMLVDLARNDLSRHGDEVKVESFKEIQFFSHVIHLVSKVTGQLSKDTTQLQLVADTFPAGTLSGAPKHMAMTLINKYENSSRGIYGGAIGHLDFDGSFNHAIMIRTFLSKNNTLYFQAGAGVVAKSIVENELQEVNNKLAALKAALNKANEL